MHCIFRWNTANPTASGGFEDLTVNIVPQVEFIHQENLCPGIYQNKDACIYCFIHALDDLACSGSLTNAMNSLFLGGMRVVRFNLLCFCLGVHKIWFKSLPKARQRLLMERRRGAENCAFIEL